ncbi:phosphotransferase family protein [Microlunatus speluncae]|uniref:phosphotransferase family protein n=1 Tax=Microlunatus speluncae TaxID=2594267 RepID=UPI0012666586|nr:phosphotransferase [Microlunatus speluncae]
MSQLSPDQAEAFLRRRYGSRAGRPVPLGAGQWSRAYAFTLDGQGLVARFGGYVEDFEKDHRMAAYASERLPIPEVLEVGETDFDDGYFAISRRARGTYLDELDTDALRTVLPAVLDALAATRAIDLSGSTGFGGWDARDHNAPFDHWSEALLAGLEDVPGRRTSGWRAKLEQTPTAAAAFDEGAEVLRQLAPRCPDRRELIHQDLLNRNVLVADGRLTAIFDWGNSLYGDGLFDLAWLLYWWPWYPDWSKIDIRRIIEDQLTDHGADAGARLLCYQLQIGLDHISYTAFMDRPDDLARNATQTLALARSA